MPSEQKWSLAREKAAGIQKAMCHCCVGKFRSPLHRNLGFPTDQLAWEASASPAMAKGSGPPWPTLHNASSTIRPWNSQLHARIPALRCPHLQQPNRANDSGRWI